MRIHDRRIKAAVLEQLTLPGKTADQPRAERGIPHNNTNNNCKACSPIQYNKIRREGDNKILQQLLPN